MERLKERLVIAERALLTLEDILSREVLSDNVVRDAAIQRFEYSFEAIWKTAQRYLLILEGDEKASPKSVVRACAAVGVLDDVDARLALEMEDDRNLTVHTYNEALARKIFSHIPDYMQLLRRWVENIKRKVAP